MVEILYYEVKNRKKCSFLDFPKIKNKLKDRNMESSSYFARENLGVNHQYSLKGVCVLCKACGAEPLTQLQKEQGSHNYMLWQDSWAS